MLASFHAPKPFASWSNGASSLGGEEGVRTPFLNQIPSHRVRARARTRAMTNSSTFDSGLKSTQSVAGAIVSRGPTRVRAIGVAIVKRRFQSWLGYAVVPRRRGVTHVQWPINVTRPIVGEATPKLCQSRASRFEFPLLSEYKDVHFGAGSA